MGSEREAIGSNLPWGKKLQLGHQERQDTGAVGETIDFHTHRPGLGQPKISQGNPSFGSLVGPIDFFDQTGLARNVQVFAGDELSTTGSRHDYGQGAVLVGGPIPQTGAVGEEDVIEQRFAVGLFDPVHFLHQVSELLHIKVIHLDEVFNESPLVVRHLVVTLGFVKQTLEQVWGVPSLRSHHESGNVGQSALQGGHHEIAHQADVFSTGHFPLHGNVQIDLTELPLHSIEPGNLQLDRPDRFEVLSEFLLIGITQIILEGTGILKHQVGDVAVGATFVRLEQPAISKQGIPHRWSSVLGSVPGNVVELNGLLVVLMAVATELQCLEGCLRPNFVRYHMVKSPSLRIRGVLQAEGTGAGEETGGALGVHIGPGAERSDPFP